MPRYLPFALLLPLLACQPADNLPVVSSFNGDSVTIIHPAFSSFSQEEILARANSICERGHKKKAEKVSRRDLPDMQGSEYLFLCLNEE